MRGEAGLLADLGSLAIPFAAHEHAAVFTVDESGALHAYIPGAHTKNLFLKDNGGAYWLVTVPAEARVDLKALPQAIGCKRVSFAKAEDMVRLIGITPGSVTPLAMVNAAPRQRHGRDRQRAGRGRAGQRPPPAQHRHPRPRGRRRAAPAPALGPRAGGGGHPHPALDFTRRRGGAEMFVARRSRTQVFSPALAGNAPTARARAAPPRLCVSA